MLDRHSTKWWLRRPSAAEVKRRVDRAHLAMVMRAMRHVVFYADTDRIFGPPLTKEDIERINKVWESMPRMSSILKREKRCALDCPPYEGWQCPCDDCVKERAEKEGRKDA